MSRSTSPRADRFLRPADPPELVAYVEEQWARGLADATIDARSRVVRRLAEWLGPQRSLASAGPRDLRAFVASRRELLAAASQVTEITYLQSFYKALLELGLIEQNPATALRAWKPAAQRLPISLAGVEALLEASASPALSSRTGQALALRDRACLELLFATGLRRSELCAARVVDLDLDQAAVLVRRAKRGKPRWLPLPCAAKDALERYLHHGRPVLLGDEVDTGHLFLSQFGAPLSHQSLYLLVKRVSERAEVRVHPHLFRRTLATELARAGVSLPAIQQILGHAHLSSTSDYVSVSVDEMREAIDQLEDQLPHLQAGPANLGNLQSRLFSGWETQAA